MANIVKLQDDLNRAIEEIGRLANEVSKSQVTVAVVSFNSPFFSIHYIIIRYV